MNKRINKKSGQGHHCRVIHKWGQKGGRQADKGNNDEPWKDTKGEVCPSEYVVIRICAEKRIWAK